METFKEFIRKQDDRIVTIFNPPRYGFLRYLTIENTDSKYPVWCVLVVKAIREYTIKVPSSMDMVDFMGRVIGSGPQHPNLFDTDKSWSLKYNSWNGWTKPRISFYKTMDELRTAHLKDLI